MVCKVFRYVTYNTALVSIFTLFFIAIERYRKICRPFKAQITLSLARRILFAIVLLTTTVFASPSFILYGHNTIYTGIENTTGVACFIDDRFRNTFSPVAYNLTLLTVVFLLGVAMVYYYINIAFQRILRSKTKPKRFKMNTADNSEYYLSSDQNEVQASALEGLKEELSVGESLRNTVTRWRAAEDVDARCKADLEQDVEKTNTSGNILIHKSLEFIPDNNNRCYTSGENGNGSCIFQHKIKTCISLNEGVEVLTSKKSKPYSVREHLSRLPRNKINNDDSNKSCGSQGQSPHVTYIMEICLSDRCASTRKCLSASNVYYLKMLPLEGEDMPCIKQSISCDTLFLESSSSCRDNTLAITEESKSSHTDNENKEVTVLTHPIKKDNRSQIEVCNSTKHTFSSELSNSVMDDTDRDPYIHDTAKGKKDYTRGCTNEVNDNAIKKRKAKQNYHKKNTFIKRSFTKSAKFAEIRDASVIKVTKMLFVITIVYFISFIPHLVLMNIVLLDEHFLISLDGIQAGIYYIGLRSFLINAVANPFVYNFMDKKFRKECKTIWYHKKAFK